jgi:hypothetical protein
MASYQDLLGTTEQTFTISPDTDAPVLKKVAGNTLQLRNNADTDFADLVAKLMSLSGTDIVIDSDGTPITYRFPNTKGTDGQFWRQKAGTPANVVEFELASPSTSGAPAPDTTNLVFGTVSPLTLFTLPANAEINLVRVIIDTPWAGGTGAQLSIGVAGNTSKYVAATKINLTKPAATVYEFNPGLIPNASAENLIATYAPGGATAGAARIVVHYGVNT